MKVKIDMGAAPQTTARRGSDVRNKLAGKLHLPASEAGQRAVRAAQLALAVGVAFQAMTIARNNYGIWRLGFCALELGVGFAAAMLAGALWTPALAQRARRWAEGYVPEASGLLGKLLARLPLAVFTAAIMTACLSVVNVAVVTAIIYRETVTLPPLAMLIRFLADIPAATVLCLVVPWLADYVHNKREARLISH